MMFLAMVGIVAIILIVVVSNKDSKKRNRHIPPRPTSAQREAERYRARHQTAYVQHESEDSDDGFVAGMVIGSIMNGGPDTVFVAPDCSPSFDSSADCGSSFDSGCAVGSDSGSCGSGE